jgi:hypothetical protein
MTAIKEWIHEFEGLGSDSMGISKVLIGNRVNLPGKRQIFQEDIEDFAFQKGMDCFETRLNLVHLARLMTKKSFMSFFKKLLLKYTVKFHPNVID